jgi:hypothetical protein
MHYNAESPCLVHKIPLHDVKVGAYCVLSVRRITGPAFMQKQLILIDKSRIYCRFFFQETEHTAKHFMQALNRVFGEGVISHGYGHFLLQTLLCVNSSFGGI